MALGFTMLLMPLGSNTWGVNKSSLFEEQFELDNYSNSIQLNFVEFELKLTFESSNKFELKDFFKFRVQAP